MSFWVIFYPFSGLTIWEIKILKLKKTSGDIIILHICSINDNHLRYGSWDMECDRQIFFVFLDCFLPFNLLPFYWPNNPKNQNFEKIKKKTPGGIIILHRCTISDNHMMYVPWDMEHDGQNFFSFWTVFCPFTPIATWKIKILKKWKKKPGDMFLHIGTKNYHHMLWGFWDMVCNGCKCYFSFWAIFALLPP